MLIDCGSNSCLFATNKGGMRSNSGCTCFEDAGFVGSATGSAKPMLIELLKLREEVERLKSDIYSMKERQAWDEDMR
jgi:hypothetical protein